ncbi:translation initiation factor 2 [Bacillus sp. M6-12]|nr:translation initiation factor 2 [Bacillus sp. M6-12]
MPIIQPENQSAVLAVIGAALSTLGDGISTIAAILALEESQQGLQGNSNNDNYNNMQKQIDYLTTEHEKLKKQINNQNPHRRK